MRPIALAVSVIVLACGAAPATAQTPDERAAARALIARRGDAIIVVLGTVKTRMSMGGREMPTSEESLQSNATILDARGLAVMSLTALEPGKMMNNLMSRTADMSGAAGMAMDMKTETANLRMRMADGREIPARIVLRDEDLDLAFVRPIEPFVSPVAFIDGPAAKPAPLDLLVGLQRLGAMAGWKVAAMFSYVMAVVDTPRTSYLGGPGLGGAVFDGAGRFVGITVMSTKSGGSTSGMSLSAMFSGTGGLDALGIMPVVLPADDIREVAKQAIDK